MTEQDTPSGAVAKSAPTSASTDRASSESRATPPVVPVASDAPARWGRVDSEGTVFVTTQDGERAVGSWQAGAADEGLAHFARKFDDVRTEVELLETRLNSHAGDPKHTLSTAQHLRDGVSEAAVVGDLAALTAHIDFVIDHAHRAIEQSKADKEQARADAVARKEELAAEAERIGSEATQWKSAGDRLRAILDEWKTIKGIDRKTDEQLWRRFSKAREAFNRRRGSHFAELDRQRAAAKTRKQELVDEAESLTESTDWGPTAARYKQLMADWKAAGRAPKESDDALWQQFRTAQDTFFSRRSAAFAERDAEFEENAKLKEQLLAEAERIDPVRDLKAAQEHLHRIQQRWDGIGKVPRERMRDLEARLRTVSDRVRSASDAQWRRTDPEAQARVDQFRERVDQFRSQADKARAAGDEQRAKKADEQAEQWQEWLAAAEQALASR